METIHNAPFYDAHAVCGGQPTTVSAHATLNDRRTTCLRRKHV